MTATERLRQLLDERGVEWEEPDPYQDATAWVGSNNIEYVAHEGISFDGPTGRLILFCLTPEQAVEATLGRGTCKVVGHGMTVCDDAEFHWYGLSCGHRLRTLWAADTVGMYCHECGRKVEP